MGRYDCILNYCIVNCTKTIFLYCTCRVSLVEFNIILLQIKQQWARTKKYHNLSTVLSILIIHI